MDIEKRIIELLDNSNYEREAKQIHAGTSIGRIISRIRMHDTRPVISVSEKTIFSLSLSAPIKATGCGPKVARVAMIMFKSVSPLVEWNVESFSQIFLSSSLSFSE